MLTSLRQKLLENGSPQQIISQLSRPAFVHSLSYNNLEQLVGIVEGKPTLYKLHGKVITTIYSIIIMKGSTTYNTKLAIQALTKYYRTLCSSNNDEQGTNKDNEANKNKDNGLANGEHLNSQAWSLKTRQVIASLLLQIPTFSNYKLIIRDISTKLVPLQLIQKHKQQMQKQCPNLYSQCLDSSWKYEWWQLIQSQQYGIQKDFSIISTMLSDMQKCNSTMQLYDKYMLINKTMQLLQNRISKSPQRQYLNIEQIFEQITKILHYSIQEPTSQYNHKAEMDKQLIPLDFSSRAQLYIRRVKSSCLELLRIIVLHYSQLIFRKVSHIFGILQTLWNKYYDQYSVQPQYLVSILTTMLTIYGIGSYNYDKLVHSDSPNCISMLIQALCLNSYQQDRNDSRSIKKQSNYQSLGKSKQKSSIIHISLSNSTLVDSAYEPYLQISTTHDRHTLMQKVLEFLISYYQGKKAIGAQYYHCAQILSILANSKNSLTNQNRIKVENIKAVVFKGFQKIGDSIQQFCQSTFNTYIKKKKDPKLCINQTYYLRIQPSSNKLKQQGSLRDSVGMSIGNQSLIGLSMQKNESENQKQNFNSIPIENSMLNSQNSQLRKTHSFDVEIEGWNSQKHSQKSSQKSKIQKSEMFYSFKEDPIHEDNQQGDQDQAFQNKKQGDDDKNQNQNEEQQQMVFTPHF